MFMRLVQAKFEADLLSTIQMVYDESIIPRFRNMPGCLYACLVQSELRKNEGISMTLWDSRESAEI